MSVPQRVTPSVAAAPAHVLAGFAVRMELVALLRRVTGPAQACVDLEDADLAPAAQGADFGCGRGRLCDGVGSWHL